MIVLGIDVGTTGTKTLAVNDKGEVVGRGYKEYSLITRSGGIVEQDALDWYDALVCSVRQAVELLDKNEITALSLSTQGASMTAVDANFNPLCNVITWMDLRAAAEAEYLNDALGKETIYHTTGYLMGAGIDASKIMWLRKNRPELTASTYSYVSTIEYINHKLTGYSVTDPTNAAIRGIYNLKNKTWSGHILKAMNIEESLLPETSLSGAYISTLTESAANDTGLSHDVKVYNGAHDQYCAALGCGAVESGDVLLSTGTTWVILGVSDKLIYSDKYISPGIHPIDGLYGELSSLRNGGSALKWYKNLISAASYSEIDQNAESRMMSAAGLYFTPYFNGAGFPYINDEVFAGIRGLQLHHDKYDLARALMEGVAFEIRRSLEEYSKSGLNVKKLKFAGGAAHSKLWTEITGYVTGCEISRMVETEACALGASLIAGVSSGMFTNYNLGIQSEKVELNENNNYSFYNEKYLQYLKYL